MLRRDAATRGPRSLTKVCDNWSCRSFPWSRIIGPAWATTPAGPHHFPPITLCSIQTNCNRCAGDFRVPDSPPRALIGTLRKTLVVDHRKPDALARKRRCFARTVRDYGAQRSAQDIRCANTKAEKSSDFCDHRQQIALRERRSAVPLECVPAVRSSCIFAHTKTRAPSTNPLVFWRP